MSRDMNTTVVLWHGQYRNDGRECLDILKDHERALFGLRNPRLVGQSGDWRLVADSTPYAPRPTDLELSDYVPMATP